MVTIKKNVLCFELSAWTICCSFDFDFTINIIGSTQTSSFKQKDRLSTIITVSNDIDYSKESNRRDRDWEALIGN